MGHERVWDRASDEMQDMAKNRITRKELANKVLAAVRQHPGCETVKEVAITQVDIVDQGPTWNVDLIDEGNAKTELAATVVRQVHDQLVARYELAA
jgi:hypothetical protein